MGLRRALLVLAAPGFLLACDGTLTGIGREPREPETPLPPAPADAVSGAASPAGGSQATGQQPTEIRAQHLLVMYTGSRSAPASVHRTRDEARARAFEALELVKHGKDFDQVVAAYTDEPGGAAKHGDLGRFTREKMVRPFADAAFALDVGQVSTVIESPFGFHVIRRTE